MNERFEDLYVKEEKTNAETGDLVEFECGTVGLVLDGGKNIALIGSPVDSYPSIKF